ncbi:hypothetical protein ACH5Y9_14325 [Methylomonas sp. BW4-1]|uniref:hypothetical protein n=1 Tax=Methylomonas sp. BW4-1 TaxID=3376685 RepID=UPI0040437A81
MGKVVNLMRSVLANIVHTAFWFYAVMFPLNAFAIDGFTQVRVAMAGIDQPGAFCEDFKLSTPQAKSVLRKARPITSAEYLESYPYLPCYVQGTANFHGRLSKWTIRAGGNISVTQDDGVEFYLGCKSCAKSFGSSR